MTNGEWRQGTMQGVWGQGKKSSVVHINTRLKPGVNEKPGANECRFGFPGTRNATWEKIRGF